MTFFALLLLVAVEPDAGGIDLAPGELPPYAKGSPPVVRPATPEPVDWNAPAPMIRTADEFREAKERSVPVIWFEHRLYFLSPDGRYLDSDTMANPTPTPRSVGEVEFTNGTGAPVEFRIYPVSAGMVSSSSGYFAAVPPYGSRVGILPVGDWRYSVKHSSPAGQFTDEGFFTAEPAGVTHVHFGAPGRGPRTARNWISREDTFSPGSPSEAEPAEKVSPAERSKIDAIIQEIPRYPSALQMSLPQSLPNYVMFKTLDSAEEVVGFYDRELRNRGWKMFGDGEGMISYMKPDRKVTLEVFPARSGAAATQFLLKVYPLD